MRTLWQGLGRIFFWSYERGSWPYDVMVIAIVIFVLLTPRSWFHDDPHTTAAAAAPGVALLSADSGDQTRTYRIDATVLAPEKRQTKSTPELERETHEILGRTVAELKDQTFQVRGIEPVLATDGGVLYYDVTVHP
jgi:hypothetical protein